MCLLLSLGLASPAVASSVGRFYANQDVFPTGYGVAEDQAQAEAFGVPIFVSEKLVDRSEGDSSGGGSVDGTARIFSLESLESRVVLSNVSTAQGTATASYSIVLPGSFLDARARGDELVYLFFATSLSVAIHDVLVSYLSEDVGILIDEGDPAFGMLRTQSSGADLFYPAVLLPNGGVGDSFSIEIDVAGGFDVVNGTTAVPKFMVGAAYVSVVPEPATAALMALGLLGLGCTGRRGWSPAPLRARRGWSPEAVRARRG